MMMICNYILDIVLCLTCLNLIKHNKYNLKLFASACFFFHFVLLQYVEKFETIYKKDITSCRRSVVRYFHFS